MRVVDRCRCSEQSPRQATVDQLGVWNAEYVAKLRELGVAIEPEVGRRPAPLARAVESDDLLHRDMAFVTVAELPMNDTHHHAHDLLSSNGALFAAVLRVVLDHERA